MYTAQVFDVDTQNDIASYVCSSIISNSDDIVHALHLRWCLGLLSNWMMSAALSYNTNPLLANRALSNVDHPVYGDDELTLYGIVCSALLITTVYHYTITMHLVHL